MLDFKLKKKTSFIAAVVICFLHACVRFKCHALNVSDVVIVVADGYTMYVRLSTCV